MILGSIGIGILLMTAQSATPPAVFDGAQWLRDPVFDGWAPVDLYHREKEPRPEITGPQNVHTLFRKEAELDSTPDRARLVITADDHFKLYINGEFVTQGPAPGYPFAHPYLVLDVTAYLQPGTNVIAAHCYYQGLYNRVWNSGGRRAGLALALDAVLSTGERVRLTTDDSWRCFTLDAFPTGRTFGYQTQFAEDIDMRRIPAGWRQAGFDDSSWQTPLTGWQDHEFVIQRTPPLQHWRAEPVRTVHKGDGRYFYDFGQELVGHTRVRVQGSAGHTIEVRHGEELAGPDTVRYEMRAGCVYQEFPVLSGRDETIEFYDYRAFRYIEILHAPAEPEVWVLVRHHPFDPKASRFASSEPLLKDIWTICKNGIHMGCQEGFLDCPSREKGQYLGDALIASRAHLMLTGDPSLTRKAIQDFQHSQRIHEGIMAVAPGSFMQEIAEYSLQWVLLLELYWRHTADRAFVEKMALNAFEPLFRYFTGFESEHGLITGMDEKWVLVDWPDNLRDNYDYDYAKTRENAVLNAFYYGALRSAARILDGLGHDAAPYEAKAEQVKAAFIARMLNPDTGLFIDAPGSSHSSLHANAVPLAMGLAPDEYVPNIVQLVRERRLSCGVYIAAFVIEGLFLAGEHELAYDLISSKDERSWHEMLKHGATTCMEAWGPDQKWNTSWLHPWSSSPIYLLAEYVAGIQADAPGWQSVRFAPRVPESLDFLEVAVPTRRGTIWSRYERDKGYLLTLPADLPVVYDVPEGTPITTRIAKPTAPRPLTDDERAFLKAHAWDDWTDGGMAVWISVDEQMLRLVEGDRIVWQRECATAELGTGSEANSYQTPLGWHSVRRKTGDDAPWGQVFRGGMPVRTVWQPGDDTEEDLVLTRVLFLDGEEPGKNKGGNVDSYARYIYIHGTNDEGLIGVPSSHGCIRLTNDDVIAVYDRIPDGTKVLITERE